ncbi:MAG: penicillin-binding protein 2, partial [Alphaproteobacteria bacterium]|nr:penicillin-binding protein 2 [Alphaproteobacteria bacterium]
KTPDPLLRVPDFKIGKTGLEKAYESHLRGTAGRLEYEVNVAGRQLREVNRMDPVQGEQLTLTLDAELQKIMYERLSQEKSAAAVVLDVHTGEIYACASYPAFDPNDFSQGIEVNLWERLNNDRAYPLNNKAFGGQYPPGSTFKMMTAMAGLEAGVGPQRTVFCPGHFFLGNKKFHCWKPGGHGTVNVKDAIAHSCDTYFYKIATEIGIEKIAETSRKFGLGSEFGTDMPEEKGGLIPDQAWKRKRFPRDKKWHQGETVVNAIGQGYMLATPLQLAVMTARIVNGGKAIKPWFVAYENSKPTLPASFEDMKVRKQNLDIVKDGMVRVVMPGGTAAASQIQEEGWQMGGKTGTSQVKAITASERAAGSSYTQESLPWHLRHHALFVGFAPRDNPRYATAVIVEHGIGGSKAAAPIAKEILREAQRLDVANRKPTPIPKAQEGEAG